MGAWDNPPVYNGNPYAPGGVGAATSYIYGKLALYKPLDDSYKYYLADSVKEDGDILTVTIKKDIFWEDGNPFTSKDIEAQFIIDGGYSGITNIWDHLESIETPDDYTVVFNLHSRGINLVKNYILTTQQRTPYHIFLVNGCPRQRN